MARTKNTARGPRTARSAAHAAPDPAPAPGASPVPGDAAAAVCAALAASPGATTVAIATAAGISRSATRDALAALEAAGQATRTKGGKPGIADTWTLTTPGPSGTEPAAGPGQDGHHAGTGEPGAAGDKQDGSGEQDKARAAQADADGGPEPAGEDTRPDGQPAATGPAQDSTAEDKTAEDGPDSGEAASAAPDETAPPAGGAAPDEAAPDDAAPDPALVAQIAGHISQIQAAASAAAAALAGGGGDLSAARAGLDDIYEQAAQARRAARAAAGGKKAPAARPGGLREKVLAHLRANPGASFTPHEIHKVNGHSSGAIANALDTLVKHGDAEVATDKPRRFRLAGAAATADAQPPAEPAAESTGAGEETDLAGAA